MYSALRGEMYRANKSVKALASDLGISEKSLRNKLNGDTAFTWPEAQTMYKLLGPSKSIDEVFLRDDESVQ